jgi:hypothetical protein
MKSKEGFFEESTNLEEKYGRDFWKHSDTVAAHAWRVHVLGITGLKWQWIKLRRRLGLSY